MKFRQQGITCQYRELRQNKIIKHIKTKSNKAENWSNGSDRQRYPFLKEQILKNKRVKMINDGVENKCRKN